MVLEENKAARAAPSVLPGENGARGSGGTGELGRARPEPVPGEGLPLFWAAASPPPPPPPKGIPPLIAAWSCLHLVEGG